MDTRRTRIQEKRANRKGFFFLVCSIALLAGIVIFGIPALANLAVFISDTKQSSVKIESDDKTPPVPPQFNPQPPINTKEKTLTLTIRSEAGSTIQIFKNGEKLKETVIDDTSSISFETDLVDGDNDFWAVATDKVGNTSNNSSRYKVRFDTEAPKIEITKPTDKETVYEKIVSVEGTTESGVKLYINDRLTIISSEGKFSQKLTLSEGENTITAKATDQAGFETETKLTVTYSP